MKLVGILGTGAAAVTVWFLVDIFSSSPAAHIAESDPRTKPRQVMNSLAHLPQATDVPPLEIRSSPEIHVSQPAAPRSREPKVPAPQQAEQQEPLSDVAVLLDQEFLSDPPPNRAAYERERTIQGLFLSADLGDKGRLAQVKCKATICRGEIEIASEAQDNAVFRRTFLSPEFAVGVQGAVSVPERRTLKDGRVIATFFIHPDAALEGLPPTGDDEEL